MDDPASITLRVGLILFAAILSFGLFRIIIHFICLRISKKKTKGSQNKPNKSIIGDKENPQKNGADTTKLEVTLNESQINHKGNISSFATSRDNTQIAFKEGKSFEEAKSPRRKPLRSRICFKKEIEIPDSIEEKKPYVQKEPTERKPEFKTYEQFALSGYRDLMNRKRRTSDNESRMQESNIQSFPKKRQSTRSTRTLSTFKTEETIKEKDEMKRSSIKNKYRILINGQPVVSV